MLLDEWLYSEEFEEQVVDFHKSLFWNNVSFSVNNQRRLLVPTAGLATILVMPTIVLEIIEVHIIPNAQIIQLM